MRETTQLPFDDHMMLSLGQDFTLPPDAILGQGVACFGAPGSGKTGILVRFLEQAAQVRMPLVAFDKEGDLLSAVCLFPRGIVATATNCPTAQDILDGGLQVVYDLRTWPQVEEASQMIVTRVEALLTLTSDLSYPERVPVLVALDEASYWLPQHPGSYLSRPTFRALHDAFHTLATAGRKRGLTPLLFTQKISELAKTVLAPGWYVFLRQTVDTDLERYMEYLQPTGELTKRQFKHRLSTLPAGKGMVKLPNGTQRLITFYERESLHLSQTPRAQAAWSRYGALPPLSPNTSFGAYQPVRPVAVLVTAAKASRRYPDAQRVQAFLAVDPTLRPVDLMKLAECDQAAASRARKAYLEAHPEQAALAAQAKRPMGKVERRLRELLAENPQYSASQLQHRTNYSSKHVKAVLARIQATSTVVASAQG